MWGSSRRRYTSSRIDCLCSCKASTSIVCLAAWHILWPTPACMISSSGLSQGRCYGGTTVSCLLVQVTPALRAVTLETLAAATAPGQAAVKLRQQLIEAAAATRGQSGGGSSGRGGRGGGRGRRSSIGGGQEGGGVAGRGMWEQMLALEAAAAAEVLGGAQVVAATCVGAGKDKLRCFSSLFLPRTKAVDGFLTGNTHRRQLTAGQDTQRGPQPQRVLAVLT